MDKENILINDYKNIVITIMNNPEISLEESIKSIVVQIKNRMTKTKNKEEVIFWAKVFKKLYEIKSEEELNTKQSDMIILKLLKGEKIEIKQTINIEQINKNILNEVSEITGFNIHNDMITNTSDIPSISDIMKLIIGAEKYNSLIDEYKNILLTYSINPNTINMCSGLIDCFDPREPLNIYKQKFNNSKNKVEALLNMQICCIIAAIAFMKFGFYGNTDISDYRRDAINSYYRVTGLVSLFGGDIPSYSELIKNKYVFKNKQYRSFLSLKESLEKANTELNTSLETTQQNIQQHEQQTISNI